MEEQGYIKLNRKLLKWGWYSDVNTLAVFIDILLHATYTEREYKGHKLKAGQAVIGRRAIAGRLGLTERQVRTALKHLHETGEISTNKVTNRFTVVTVENWGKYQEFSTYSDQQSDQQATNKRPTSDHKQKGKKEKKERIIINGFDNDDEIALKRQVIDNMLIDAERNEGGI